MREQLKLDVMNRIHLREYYDGNEYWDDKARLHI